MISYRVYLTDMKNEETMYKVENKDEVRKCVNDANKAGFFEFKIIMNLDGNDIFIKKARFKDGYEIKLNEALEYEYKIDGGIIRRYKPAESQGKDER